MSDTIQAVVLGATGYVGGELLRLIAGHPDLQFAAAVSTSRDGQEIAATYPNLAGAYGDERFVSHGEWLDKLAAGSKLALFSAAPHGASAALVADALAATAKKDITVHVVDSSADFRYANQLDYEVVYGTGHGAPDLLADFQSGVPEHVIDVRAAHVGHPGCFATAVLLAIVPMLRSGLTESEVFVNGITGSTGSGRSPQAGTHHPERHSNLYAYKPLAHRHSPEIAGLAEAASGRETTVHFVPHSGPFARGIHATVQAKTTQPVSVEQLTDVFERAYADSPFVEVTSGTPRLKDVIASNHCRIGVAVSDDTVVVMSVIDNLVKGAAGGSVQWMNRLWGLPEANGLGAAAPGWT
ncbi:MAG: N-acetyl-gamma-glutamyl-phosphate reductase [Gammaproteobacteria bacterium]|nr:N-acetyl-gamma-glutamyl-phosphate reductase [Gammaproteobacteria bacterium]MDH3432647.1 N-acetyl-gamma-glutamyl-phosphate reductase [Gammaproteobacteria bacterium]